MTEKEKKKRMTLPKKQQDIEKVVQEIEERGGEDHHHHSHGDLDEIIAIVELLIDSLNVKMKELEDKVKLQSNEITRLYRVLALILRYMATDDESEKKEIIENARKILEF
jgi:ribosomal protein S6